MLAQRVTADLGDPSAAEWASLPTQTVVLAPPPLATQPTEYVRAKWADREYGTVRAARVAAAHDGARLFVRVEWGDDETPNAEFHDAAAVYFPAGDDAPAATFGSEESPVHMWYWQANLAGAKHLDATGPGVFRPDGGSKVDAAAALGNGDWSVVLTGALEEAVNARRLGVAVWNGSNEERAGLGACVPDWLALEIE